MAMLPFTCAVLGLQSGRGREQSELDETAADVVAEHLHNVPEMRTPRQSRRSTSYYNSFQTTCVAANDDPPTYVQACRHSRPTRPIMQAGREALPAYSSTVNAEAKMLVNVESISPLHGNMDSEWRETYVVLRGTLLSFHRVKDGGKGRLLRKYTLQHAEVGLAPDIQHTVLIPQTRLAHFVPTAARRRAWQKDPDLFRPVRQIALRLRAETDQMVLAHPSEETVHQFIYAIGAAIDISPAIDERSLPKQCTVPRRRRRVRHVTGDIADPILLAQQERLFRAMYPGFAEDRAENGQELQRVDTSDSQVERPESSARDEDELDLAAIREEGNIVSIATNGVTATTTTETALPSSQDPMQRPQNMRQTTVSSFNSTFSDDMIHATSPDNFTDEGKWQPPNTRTPAQVQRYIKRCMPVLLIDAVRASDVLICNGKRVRIDWEEEVLEEWTLQPPSYTSHSFEGNEVNGLDLVLQRTNSRCSASGSGTEAVSPSPSSMSGHDTDAISPVEQGFGNLKLSKTDSTTSNSTTSSRQGRRRDSTSRNSDGIKSGRAIHADIHGVVFCF